MNQDNPSNSEHLQLDLGIAGVTPTLDLGSGGKKKLTQEALMMYRNANFVNVQYISRVSYLDTYNLNRKILRFYIRFYVHGCSHLQ